MLAVDELERAGYQTVVVTALDTQGRPVGRQLPLRRFLDDPAAGVEVSSDALVYDLAGIPLQDSPFVGAQTGYHDIRLRPDLSTLRPYPGVPGTAICLADAVDAAGNARLNVTFMVRPVADDLGTSCHLHFSLWANGHPEFPTEPGSGSLATHYVAHARAEWAATLVAVSDWELTRGFEAV